MLLKQMSKELKLYAADLGWRHLYRDHVITAFPSFDTATNSWMPQADITWCVGPDRQSKFVRFKTRVMTETEAVDHALTKSVVWINRRLKPVS